MDIDCTKAGSGAGEMEEQSYRRSEVTGLIQTLQ